MDAREKIINAIEKAKKQSEEYAQDKIIVPFKEADMIISLLKEQEAVKPHNTYSTTPSGKIIPHIFCGKCNKEIYAIYAFCPFCGQVVKWE